MIKAALFLLLFFSLLGYASLTSVILLFFFSPFLPLSVDQNDFIFLTVYIFAFSRFSDIDWLNSALSKPTPVCLINRCKRRKPSKDQTIYPEPCALGSQLIVDMLEKQKDRKGKTSEILEVD